MLYDDQTIVLCWTAYIDKCILDHTLSVVHVSYNIIRHCVVDLFFNV